MQTCTKLWEKVYNDSKGINITFHENLGIMGCIIETNDQTMWGLFIGGLWGLLWGNCDALLVLDYVWVAGICMIRCYM